MTSYLSYNLIKLLVNDFLSNRCTDKLCCSSESSCFSFPLISDLVIFITWWFSVWFRNPINWYFCYFYFQFCLTCAAVVSADCCKNVLYIDTQGGFSVERLQEIIHTRGKDQVCNVDVTNTCIYLYRKPSILCHQLFHVIKC